MVRSHHTWYLFLLLLRDVNERGAGGCGTVMWVCASLGCKAHVGSFSYIRSSCTVWVSSFWLSFIVGERLAMGSVEQRRRKIIG